MTRTVALGVFLVLSVLTASVFADVRLPRIFTDHMVLQRDMPLPIWGWAEPGEKVTVELAGQVQTATADDDGKWRVTMEPLTVGNPRRLVVKGDNQVVIDDILVGEVWICSGQSNMEWPVSAAYGADLVRTEANLPEIRLLSVKPVGSQTPADDIDERWQVCTPQTVNGFSAVGYFFGRQLHNSLGVPVGLINNAWGGSSCEAWIPRDEFQDEELYGPMMARWEKTESEHDEAKLRTQYEAQLNEWREARDAAEADGRPIPPRPGMNHPLFNQHRPGNLYNARIAPLVPFAVRGAIWYQGESNADRAYQYREMFPLMIESWRTAWGQDKLPFYWVQLADYKSESPDPMESAWAELREAQTMTTDKLPRTGQAVIIDIGEGKDIHPRNKEDVGERLARWALANEYGVKIDHASPRYDHLEVKDGKAIVTFRDVGGGLRTFDIADVRGFTIAGEDRKWHSVDPKDAKIIGKNKVEVSSEEVSKPIAVRYAWADNPVCNLYSATGLPLTPFRTDDWPGVTANNR